MACGGPPFQHDNECSVKVRNFFTEVPAPFPTPFNGKVKTFDFLRASRRVVTLIDQFGPNIFRPVKSDMLGNITKLENSCNSYGMEVCQFLNDIVSFEKQEGKSYATDALLWLKRGLEFFHRFLKLFLQDSVQGKKTEDLSCFMRAAYQQTLERYHGWVPRHLFEILCPFCPSRSALVEVLTLKQVDQEDSLMISLDSFLTQLEIVLEIVSALCEGT